MKGHKVRLLDVITSTCKKDVIYGIIGEKVEIISVMGDILLVKNIKGGTFPVQTIKTDYKI